MSAPSPNSPPPSPPRGASHLVTLINLGTPVARPDTILAENHLFVGINDIVEPADGLVLAGDDHVARADRLLRALGPDAAAGRPLLRRHQPLDRRRLHRAVRGAARPRRARPSRRRCASASPIATPNGRLVAIADRLLGRDGRMVAAIAEIGRGEMALENVPFVLALED